MRVTLDRVRSANGYHAEPPKQTDPRHIPVAREEEFAHVYEQITRVDVIE
jgi:hypothetical protein